MCDERPEVAEALGCQIRSAWLLGDGVLLLRGAFRQAMEQPIWLSIGSRVEGESCETVMQLQCGLFPRDELTERSKFREKPAEGVAWRSEWRLCPKR